VPSETPMPVAPSDVPPSDPTTPLAPAVVGRRNHGNGRPW